MQPKVFIIILNWNGCSDTIECIKSLKEIDYLNYEIIVVDNGSKEKLALNETEGLKIIYNKENLGFAGGNNVGVKYALEQNADYILLLNNDTLTDQVFLKEMVRVGESEQEIGILGPKIYFYDTETNKKTNKIWFAGGKINKIFTRGIHIGHNQEDKGQYDKNNYYQVDYITGCCLLIKRKVIEKIGLINKDYFLYYEDADWCLRARREGFKCVLASKAKIWHKCSKSAVEGSPSYIYYHSRNGLMLAKYNGSTLILLAAYLQSIWILGKQVIKLAIPSKRIWAKAVIKGIMDFYKGRIGKINL